MKNILILGASSLIGKSLAEHLREANVKVTLFSRSVTKEMFAEDEKQVVIRGDVLNTDALSSVMKDQDIVVASLNGDHLAMSESIIMATRGSKVSKIYWVTVMGIHNEVPGLSGQLWNLLIKTIPNYVHAANTIVASGIDYTILRCGDLSNENNSSYTISHKGEKVLYQPVSRRAVGKFIADMITGKYPLSKNSSFGITG